MATLALGSAFSNGLRNLNDMSVGRQLAILGIAVGGIMVAVAIVLWALRPTYAPLFTQIDGAEAAEVMQALDQMGVPYQVDATTSQIKIPQQQIAETRLLLAGQGLPRSADLGFELLQEETGFSTSRLMENARFQRALEGELARSISALDPVEVARVHLAQPEHSVFVRERSPASASVIVHLRGGGSLSDAQVAAIVHLVSSSVPGLNPEQVTVVDQRGTLLTQQTDTDGLYASSDQLDYIRRVEEIYANRVRSLLVPLLGENKVRVQVAADVDFARVERTEESYDPNRTAIRSEQINEEERLGSELGPGGVPGALTNQPPAGGALDENNADGTIPKRRSMQSTRNYEVDRTIAYVREMPGTIRRLSTAVVVDYTEQTNEEGATEQVPRSEAELEGIRALVREAVGFDAERGDSINVLSAAFNADQFVVEPIPIWEQPWFMDLAKLVAGIILALLILLIVVRPVLKQLLAGPEEDDDEDDEEALAAGEQAALGGPGGPGGAAALTGPDGTSFGMDELDGPDQQELHLQKVRELIKEDPKRVAQVMKVWLNVDGNNS
jgi:flagellar M-ring protein FliF